jgi:hypothetical protein
MGRSRLLRLCLLQEPVHGSTVDWGILAFLWRRGLFLFVILVPSHLLLESRFELVFRCAVHHIWRIAVQIDLVSDLESSETTRLLLLLVQYRGRIVLPYDTSSLLLDGNGGGSRIVDELYSGELVHTNLLASGKRRLTLSGNFANSGPVNRSSSV